MRAPYFVPNLKLDLIFSNCMPCPVRMHGLQLWFVSATFGLMRGYFIHSFGIYRFWDIQRIADLNISEFIRFFIYFLSNAFVPSTSLACSPAAPSLSNFSCILLPSPHLPLWSFLVISHSSFNWKPFPLALLAFSCLTSETFSQGSFLLEILRIPPR